MLSDEARRAAVYIGGGVLLVAWLAAANSATRQDLPVRSSPAPAAAPDALALEVQAQAERLRERLMQAPSPTIGPRNPFSFASSGRAPVTPPMARELDASGEPAAAPNPALALTLMGVAEEPSPEGLHRTAIIGGQADAIFMVVEGQAFADRYRVVKIGADAVELQDLLTGGTRTLALK